MTVGINAPNNPMNSTAIRISGWLLFYMFSMPIGAILSLVTSVVSLSDNALAIIDVAISLILLLVAILADVRLYYRKQDAIILVRTYLITCFVINIFVLLFGDNAQQDIIRLVTSVIVQVMWFLYFLLSKQVSEVCPKCARNSTLISKTLISVLIAAPIAFLVGLVFNLAQNGLPDAGSVESEYIEIDE